MKIHFQKTTNFRRNMDKRFILPSLFCIVYLLLSESPLGLGGITVPNMCVRDEIQGWTKDDPNDPYIIYQIERQLILLNDTDQSVKYEKLEKVECATHQISVGINRGSTSIIIRTDGRRAECTVHTYERPWENFFQVTDSICTLI